MPMKMTTMNNMKIIIGHIQSVHYDLSFFMEPLDLAPPMIC